MFLLSRFSTTSGSESGVTRNLRRQAGLSLIEIIIVLNVIVVAFLGISSVFATNRQSFTQMNRRAVALREATAVVEKMRSEGFACLGSVYDGHSFSVDEIDGTGTVTFFLDETDGSAQAAELGLPRDLDGDDVATNLDVSSGYVLLPMVVQVEWPGQGGLNRVRLYHLMAEE